VNRVAIAFSTCDRVELTKQSIQPLLQLGFDLHWVDGSKTEAGLNFVQNHDIMFKYTGVRGGSGAAIVFALTAMLKHDYTHIGLVENDVVLKGDWFDQTMSLFEQGNQDGLTVGAVSARCYEERILIQRPDYAICHNLGAGMIIFTREAAQLVLNEYRVQFTTENRQIFSQLTGYDIARDWAFGGQEHFLVADWRWDALLASHGMASLALIPSPVEMIGQNPPLAEQNLTLATDQTTELAGDDMFDRYRSNLQAIRTRQFKIASHGLFHRDVDGSRTIFAHQINAVNGIYQGEWRLKDAPGFGPFGWTAKTDAVIEILIYGNCEIVLGGGKDGGQVYVKDTMSNYEARPVLPPEGAQGQVVSVHMPGFCHYRKLRIEMTTPGTTFYAVRCKDEQPMNTGFRFDYDVLPKP
jgi:hypothetical protein